MVDILNDFQDLDSQYLFKLVSEDATDLIAILNDKSKFEYVNSKAHKKLTGYTEKDLIGKIAIDLIYPKDQKKAIKNLSCYSRPNNLVVIKSSVCSFSFLCARLANVVQKSSKPYKSIKFLFSCVF